MPTLQRSLALPTQPLPHLPRQGALPPPLDLLPTIHVTLRPSPPAKALLRLALVERSALWLSLAPRAITATAMWGILLPPILSASLQPMGPHRLLRCRGQRAHPLAPSSPPLRTVCCTLRLTWLLCALIRTFMVPSTPPPRSMGHSVLRRLPLLPLAMRTLMASS